MGTKAQIYVLSGHTATVADVHCQESEPQVITDSMNSTVQLWDLVAGKTHVTLTPSTRSRSTRSSTPSRRAPREQQHQEVDVPRGRVCVQFWRARRDSEYARDECRGGFSGANNGSITLWDYNTSTSFQKMEDVPPPGSLEGVFCSTFDIMGAGLIRRLRCVSSVCCLLFMPSPLISFRSRKLTWSRQIYAEKTQ
ncbi:hypothetical protein B0H14DRAFT_499903 [Mycena olivaceomarginata]|nr:hypothetical protein B0H14DRAFT_499903 [Mycena olivaceomarginata]